jgi:undecaprenyl-diphosphatase
MPPTDHHRREGEPSVRGGLPAAVRRHLDPTERYGLRLTLVGVAIVLVAVPFSTLLFQVLAKGPLTRADGAVANAMNARVHDHHWAVVLLEGVSWLGRPPLLAVLVVVAIVYVHRRGQRRLVLFLLVTPLGGGIVDTLVKALVDRPRPIVDHPVVTAFGKSFPSGHAMSATVTYGALLLVFLPALAPARRRLALAATTALVLAVGMSRLLLGVHFVSDVVGGYVLGLAWLAGAVAAFETWRVDEGRRPAHPLDEGIEPEAAEALG